MTERYLSSRGGRRLNVTHLSFTQTEDLLAKEQDSKGTYT